MKKKLSIPAIYALWPGLYLKAAKRKR